MITIGSTQLATSTPPDLNAQVIAATGCSADELAGIIRANPVPGLVAQALRPLLTEPIALLDLADMIAAADAVLVVPDVLALYAAPAAAPVVAEPIPSAIVSEPEPAAQPVPEAPLAPDAPQEAGQ